MKNKCKYVTPIRTLNSTILSWLTCLSFFLLSLPLSNQAFAAIYHISNGERAEGKRIICITKINRETNPGERTKLWKKMAAITDKKPFPEADVDNELNPAHNKRVEPDSTSSSIATSQANQEKAEVQKKSTCGGDQKKDCCGSNLKRTVIISVIVAAVAAAAFGIAKKLKEKQT